MLARLLLLLATLTILGCRTTSPAQSPTFRPYLAAMSVANVDETARWYRETLDFAFVSRNDYPSHGMTIAILERDGFRLELVQLATAVAPATVVPNYENPASLHGIGKLSFYMNDFDRRIAHLRDKGVRFQIEPRTSEVDGKRTCIVLDNNGNWLQLIAINE